MVGKKGKRSRDKPVVAMGERGFRRSRNYKTKYSRPRAMGEDISDNLEMTKTKYNSSGPRAMGRRCIRHSRDDKKK